MNAVGKGKKHLLGESPFTGDTTARRLERSTQGSMGTGLYITRGRAVKQGGSEDGGRVSISAAMEAIRMSFRQD